MACAKAFSTALGASFLLVSGALLCTPSAAAEPAPTPKSIHLGVDPDKYLQNRHRRVSQARRAANARANAVPSSTAPRFGAPRQGAQQGASSLAPHPSLADRPGFNEFSRLNPEEQKNAQEIMQFLKKYQATQTP